jgi:two-component system nitrogen regulation response regulator GlnG
VGRILVVDDDAGIQRALRELLGNRGHTVASATSGESALEILERESHDVVMLDVWLPGLNGLETFQRIKAKSPKTPVIVMTGTGTMDIAIEASKLGAFDYRMKPFEPGPMLAAVEKALDAARLTGQTPEAADEVPLSDDLIIGYSARMQELFRAIGRVAATEATVLIRGESGTGKELVARVICKHSRRAESPMITVNCAAIPETLLESELFGFERGAFTGAHARRVGMFERADGGTILLDEIGDVPLGIQAKILRVLQERTFERIGGTETVRVDVRILAATNRDLEQAIAEGLFRADLYHRLNVVTMQVPPLRDHADDIPALAQSFVARFATELEIEKPALSQEAMEVLVRHPWPGNVRELEHCLRRVLIFTRGFAIQADDVVRAMKGSAALARATDATSDPDRLREFVKNWLEQNGGPGCEPRFMETVERELLTAALNRAGGNQSRAAELLGIPRPTLHARLQRLGIRTTTVVDEGGGTNR